MEELPPIRVMRHFTPEGTAQKRLSTLIVARTSTGVWMARGDGTAVNQSSYAHCAGPFFLAHELNLFENIKLASYVTGFCCSSTTRINNMVLTC